MPAYGSVDNFTLFGFASKGWGFTSESIISPGPTITVTQNDVVNLTLTSADGLQHKFFIDYNGNGILDADEPTSGPFTTTISLLINANVVGTFRYFCAFHPNIMYGTFTVTNASTKVSAVNFASNILCNRSRSSSSDGCRNSPSDYDRLCSLQTPEKVAFIGCQKPPGAR